MSKIQTIQAEWVVQLFENTFFQSKLKNFIQNFQQFSKNIMKNDSIFIELDTLSQEISGMMLEQISKQNEQKLRYLTVQLGKIQNQIAKIKGIVPGEDEKIDLSTEINSYYKSKLEYSAILDQDITADFNELRSNLKDLQSKVNTFFSGKLVKTVELQQQNTLKQIQAFSSQIQKRMDQVSKTLTNVLEMLNEQNSKKQQKDESFNLKEKKTSLTNSTNPSISLIRQSSLQNLNLSKLFTLGRK